jgi:transposase
MQTVTTIGFDIAKSVFQVHGVDAVGQVAIRRQLKRRHVLAFFEQHGAVHTWHIASFRCHAEFVAIGA